MGLSLNKIHDPRSALEKVRRRDLRRYIEQNRDDPRLQGISPEMPQRLIVKKMQEKGIHDVSAPKHRLGQPESPHNGVPLDVPDSQVNTMSADALLEAQWQEQKKEQKPVEGMSFLELRKETKRRGLKQKRTDRLEDLRSRLIGDTSASSQ